jgi:hypothetical protein
LREIEDAADGWLTSRHVVAMILLVSKMILLVSKLRFTITCRATIV